MGERFRTGESPAAGGEGWSTIITAISDLRSELGERHEEQAVTLDQVTRRLDALNAAFPDGDLEGHRRVHETMIAKNIARTQFYTDLRNDLAKKGLWVVIIAVGTVALRYAQTHIRIFY